MITEQELQTALQSFIGQDYNKWSTHSKVYSAVKELLVANGLDDQKLYWDDDGQTVIIKYKKIPLLEVMVSKAKGKKHYGYCGTSYNDWSVKGITVNVLGRTHDINDGIAEIEEYLVRQKEASDKKLQEAIAAVRAMKSALPGKSDWDLRELIKYISENRYTICEKAL